MKCSYKNSLEQKDNRTDGGFAKLVIRNLAGDVGAHQDADVHVQFLSDDVRYELDSIWTLAETLDR